MSLQKLLVRKVTIERETNTVSAMGEHVFTFSVIATKVPCDLQMDTGSFSRREVGEFSDATHRGYFLATQDVQEKDKLTDEFGVTYEVRFVFPIVSRGAPGAVHHLECELVSPQLLRNT